jgi:hypothetical protein
MSEHEKNAAAKLAQECEHDLWNTGRYYAPEGQVISVIHDRRNGLIYFADVSRGISGVIEVSALPDPVQQLKTMPMTMDGYDTGEYRFADKLKTMPMTMDGYDTGEYRFADNLVETFLLRMAEKAGREYANEINSQD